MPDTNPYSSTTNPGPSEKSEFVCENCGCRLFERVKPESGFAFAYDYQCRQCKEQIPAQVPLWGSLLMLGIGAAITLAGAAIFLGGWMNQSGIALIAGIVVLVFGLGFSSAGYRSFFYK